MKSNDDYTIALESLCCAAKALVYCRDNSPGRDLGATASALCWMEMRKALLRLEAIEGASGFDAKAYLKELGVEA